MDLHLDWADVLAQELVSIALISADGLHIFHAERNSLPTDPMSWVRSVVYPLLERGAAAMDDATLMQQLREFLARLHSPSIHYDFGHDWSLCQHVIDGLEVSEPKGPIAAVTWMHWMGCTSRANGNGWNTRNYVVNDTTRLSTPWHCVVQQ